MGLVEGYDLSSMAESAVVALSIRGYSQPGNGALLMGFISRANAKVKRGQSVHMCRMMIDVNGLDWQSEGDGSNREDSISAFRTKEARDP